MVDNVEKEVVFLLYLCLLFYILFPPLLPLPPLPPQSRPRTPKDYHYIISSSKTQGANDPAAFTARMKAGELVGLNSSAFQTFEKEYADIKARRDVFARQLALDAKIENSQVIN